MVDLCRIAIVHEKSSRICPDGDYARTVLMPIMLHIHIPTKEQEQ